MITVALFHVINGEDEEGSRAVTTDGTLLKDGWYFLLDDEAFTMNGPYNSRGEAACHGWLYWVNPERELLARIPH